MNKVIKLGNRLIGEGQPSFIIGEVSANHNQSYDTAVEIIRGLAKAGADAVKLQTYRPDTITLDCDNEYFQIKQGTLWDGTTLYKLYEQAFTPWEWHKGLQAVAEEEGLFFFSTPFDFTAVDLLESLDVPLYKIASFEINDIPLIRYVAKKKKPILISTGIAEEADIALALKTCKDAGNEDVILLKCSSSYPTPLEDINLRTIPHMSQRFEVSVGLSDHTLGHTVAVGAVALSASVVEKHVTTVRAAGGVDSAFSMELTEFAEMVKEIRALEAALGRVTYDLTQKQKNSREHSRSLFAVKDIAAGEPFTKDNVKSIRPAYGLHTKYYYDLMSKTATTNIKRGTPLDWSMVNQ